MDFQDEHFYEDGGGDWLEEAAEGGATNNHNHNHYKILKEEDIKHLQQKDISTVSGVLSVSRGVACSLLCQNNWILSSAYDQWFDVADGERNPDPTVKPPHGSIQQLCNICHQTTLPEKLVSASCDHLFCTDCWKIYIAEAVSAGDACLRLRCPDLGCRAAVTFDMVEKLASEGDAYRYEEYLRRSYVESSRNRKWCPGAGCDRAVEFDLEVESERYDVVCECSHKFCWKCGVEWHSPVDCKAAAEWVERNRSEAASTMWILDNTKPCPKCGRPIEDAYIGNYTSYIMCNAPCSFEFCWKCSAPWKGMINGSCWSGCGLKNHVEEARRNKAKRFSDKYIGCYERWDFNDKVRKRAMVDLERARKRYGGMEEMKFVVEAWEQIVEFLRVLKWSYVYGYYLSSEEGRKTTLFELLQVQAEDKLESLLHHCVDKEKEIGCDVKGFSDDDSEFGGKLLCLISITRKYIANFVRALENGLDEVENYVVMAEAENLGVALDNDLAHKVECSAPNSEKEKEKEKEKGRERERSSMNDTTIFYFRAN